MIQLRPHQARIVERMTINPKGQVIVPTGGGKTLCMIKDAQREFNTCSWDVFVKKPERKTVVVVSPRILLAQQHCDDFEEFLGLNPMLQRKVLHVHSGDTSYESTTKSKEISTWHDANYRYNKLIFTTYHSLHRIQESGIPIHTVYFDEAHNSIQRHFFPATEYFSAVNNIRCYFFTATPKYNKSIDTPSMDDEAVYGKEIERITPRELIDSGYILPPKLSIKELEMTEVGRTPVWKECEHLLETIDEIKVDKVLVCARRIAQIVNLVEDTKFIDELSQRGYSYMYITSQTGAIIDGEKVNREEFFDVLSTWGKEDSKRFIVLHHSILAEGINCPGLEAAVFMRNMNPITISQTIGRVIRTGNDDKKHGIVTVPVYDRVGISTAKKVSAVVDMILA